MEIIESINNYSDFDNSQIIEFIKLGNDLIQVHSEIESEQYLNSFLSYSRNYMNFLMNHTNYLYILYVYKCLLKKIDDNQDYIRYIIKINNFVLSIIENIDFTDKIKPIQDFPEYFNYLLAIKDLLTTNINYRKLQDDININELVINLTIIESKEQIEQYSKNEFYDNLRFYFYNINEIQIYVKNDLLLNAIKQLQSIELKQTSEYIQVIQLFTKSIYNLLQNEHSEQINEIESILNPLTEFTPTSYSDIDKFIQSVIKTNIQQPVVKSQPIVKSNQVPVYKQSDSNIFQGIILSSVVGFILYDMKYNII